jgi:hypothetical protein
MNWTFPPVVAVPSDCLRHKVEEVCVFDMQVALTQVAACVVELDFPPVVEDVAFFVVELV